MSDDFYTDDFEEEETFDGEKEEATIDDEDF